MIDVFYPPIFHLTKPHLACQCKQSASHHSSLRMHVSNHLCIIPPQNKHTHTQNTHAHMQIMTECIHAVGVNFVNLPKSTSTHASEQARTHHHYPRYYRLAYIGVSVQASVCVCVQSHDAVITFNEQRLATQHIHHASRAHTITNIMENGSHMMQAADTRTCARRWC